MNSSDLRYQGEGHEIVSRHDTSVIIPPTTRLSTEPTLPTALNHRYHNIV